MTNQELFKLLCELRLKKQPWSEITEHLNKRQLYTPTGLPWTPSTLAAFMSRFKAGQKQTIESKTTDTPLVDLIAARLDELDLDQKVAFINEIKIALHNKSPFKSEPVDCVVWLKKETIQANDYNPNKVAPPEMRLLETSILEDGYTQPIVAWKKDEEAIEVVDGFHRNRIGKESKEVSERIHGYLPVVIINASRSEKGDRIASTIRHNRARGKHQVGAMSDIVIELKRRNWSDQKISKHLGMEPDEVLRLAQITGLSELFADREFSKAWEAESINEDDDLTDVDQEARLETHLS